MYEECEVGYPDPVTFAGANENCHYSKTSNILNHECWPVLGHSLEQRGYVCVVKIGFAVLQIERCVFS